MKYHLKLVFSPAKWIICLLFVIVIPLAMYVPTFYDFVNISALYLPFIGIVLFADITLLDKESHTEEVAYLSNKSPVKTFILRYLISLGVFVTFLVLANVIFKTMQLFGGEPRMIEPISNIDYILIAAGGSLFFGAISMTFSTVLNNVYIGYGFSTIYWIFWNVNCTREEVLNPFPFLANPTFYEKPLATIYILTLILIVINCAFVGKSPFYLSDKLRKVFIK